MFSILLSIPKSNKYSNPNEVNWESIHSHFDDLFSEDFICVVKPFNGDHTLAKVYFKRKVGFPNRSDDILINNSIPAKIREYKEEPNLPSVSSQTVRLPFTINEAQFLEIRLNLEDQFRVNLQLNVTSTHSNVTISGCHPEVLDCAEKSLRKWANELLSPSVATAVSSAGATGHSNSGGATARRPAARRLLFPDALEDADDGDQNLSARPTATASAAAAAGPPSRRAAAELQRDLGGPYDFELALNSRCSLRVQPLDITALQCDVMLVTTSCALSLNYGLARVVAAKSNQRILQHLCQQRISSAGNLKFGETHLVAVPPGSSLPARHILFVALPNDKRLTDSIDAAKFKEVMQTVAAGIINKLADLSGDPGLRILTVAMTALGANLPYWADQSEDFAHVLAGALHNARETTGHLRRITICDLQLEVLATLGRVIEARFRVRINMLSSCGSSSPSNRLRELNSTQPAAVVVNATGGGDCAICCSELTSQNPAVKFHCDRGLLCASCVRRLQDPGARPSDGRCPLCMERYRPALGSQPSGGSLTVVSDASCLPGHEGQGTLVVTYTFPGGIQGTDHPSPGRPYRGASRVTYFPDSPEGRSVVQRLKAAFAGRCVFTVGTSATTGMENAITWATVHHKTSTSGGPERHGYPDPTYLKRISDELQALGY